MSLANAVAIGTCAASIVLIGDQNQLPMVTQGVQPGGAAASSLEHLVGQATTIPQERGLFLETSRRMHPAVNAFISPAFYGGLLDDAPGHRARGSSMATTRSCPAPGSAGCQRRTPATRRDRGRRPRSSRRPSPTCSR